VEIKREYRGLFPTPVAIVDNLDCGERIRNYLNTIDMIANGDQQVYGRRSVDTYVLDAEECKEFTEKILLEMQVISTQVMRLPYVDYQFTQSWVTHKEHGQSHAMHHHPNSVLSGVYYFNEHNDAEPLMFHQQFSTTGSSMFAPSPMQPEIIESKSNRMIVFPSYMLHSVPMNKSPVIRKSLAFNMIPLHVIGDKDSLMELRFDKLK
jgi:hypothetical protein